MTQTTAGLTNNGQTAHYQISYDSSLPNGLTLAAQLWSTCEFDFNLMQGWFQGVEFRFSFPIAVQLNNGGGGASWNDPPDIEVSFFGYNPTVQIGAAGGTLDFVRYLLVSEVVEMFMASKNNGWFENSSIFSGADEGSKGEGLSRFLGFQYKLANGTQNIRYTGFEVVALWLNSSRPNNVDSNPDDHNPDVVTGCVTAFIHFLHSQLGFGITAIINAGSDTLGGVYNRLTGRNDGWQSFIDLVNLHYPPGRTYNPNGDNLFPVPNLDHLGDDQIVAGDTVTVRDISLDTQAPAEVTIALTSDTPAVLSLPAQITIPPGDWSAGLSLTAAPVTGPKQAVSIHATYAGKTLSATIDVLPRPSIVEGQVTDTALRGINDATVIFQSDTEILPGSGNTLQLSTDANGFYRTPTIPPRVYQVSAASGVYVPQSATVMVSEGAPITRHDFRLVRTLPFTISGRVTDPAGPAVAGATVRLEENSPVPGIIQVVTDASGHYSISMDPGPYAGSYSITASASGFVASTAVLPSIANGASLTESFVLAPLGAIAGFVGDASKTPIAPIAGAQIAAGSLLAVSDATGTYTLSGLTPGQNNVALTADGFDPVQVTVTVVSGVTTTQNFILTEASATMTGTITDTDSGAPLRTAIVRVEGLSTEASAGGVYTITGIPAGQWQVMVTAPHHFSQTTLVQFRDHQVLQMDFQMDSTRKPVGDGPPATIRRSADRS